MDQDSGNAGIPGDSVPFTAMSLGEWRRVMQITAMALASMDKSQMGYYERRFRPEEWPSGLRQRS